MKKYELMLLIQGQIPEDLAKEVSLRIKKNIEDMTGKVLEEDFWGRRKLAYKIDNQEHGYYSVLVFEIEGASLEKIEKELKLINEVLRFLITRKEEAKIKDTSKKAKKKEIKLKEKTKKETEKKEKPKEVTPKVSKEPKLEKGPKPEKKDKERLKELDKKIDEILKD